MEWRRLRKHPAFGIWIVSLADFKYRAFMDVALDAGHVVAPGANLFQCGNRFTAYTDIPGQHTGCSCLQQGKNGGGGKK